MQALISPMQNNLVAQVEQNSFEVAEPLFWVNCPDTIIAGEFTYDGSNFVPYVPTITAEQNKATATKKLYETDWATIADVADPKLSNPYLMNQAEFFAYRSQLRAIAVNPVAGQITFPTKPKEQWSN